MPSYKDEKTGTWFCKFYYTDFNGVKKQKKKRGFKTQRDAKAWERNFLETKALDVNIKFSNFVEVYLEDMKKRWKPAHYISQKYRIHKRIMPFFGELMLPDIKPVHVRQWQNELVDYRDEDGQPLADSYLKVLCVALSGIFNYAVKYYDLKENPCIKAGSIGSTKPRNVDFWTLDEFNKFIKVVKTTKNIEFYTAFNILYFTGIRIGELLALTWGDVDIENNVIHITKSLQKINGEEILTSPKTSKSVRDILIFDYLTAIIKEYKKCIYKPHNNDRLFEFSADSIRQIINTRHQVAGVKRIRVHDLRHSHASLLIELGFPPLLVAERLGHEKVQTTLSIYSHLYPNKHNEVAEKLQSIMSDSVPN